MTANFSRRTAALKNLRYFLKSFLYCISSGIFISLIHIETRSARNESLMSSRSSSQLSSCRS